MKKICVIGLGYVGLPVALGISRIFDTVGFDIDSKRILELKRNFDSNNEFLKKNFKNKKIKFTNKISDLKKCNFFIICVPTPVSKKKLPNLNPINKSISMLTNLLKKGDIIVLESTVYPGVTNNCGKFLSKKTGLKNNKDFFMCYSPERINPGDNSRKLNKIEKVFAIKSNNKNLVSDIKKVYKLISKKIIFSTNISETETAKVIENTQRDLNIALYNELLVLSQKMKMDFNEIIRLASSKWNFLKFKPGLVGGHCLPVDPYYLSHIASKNNFLTKTALAGRATNNYMKTYVLKNFFNFIKKNKIKKNAKVLIVGISYKYGVSDLRNSLNFEIFKIINRKFKNAKYFDPFVKYKNKMKSLKTLKSYNPIIFLSYGKIYKNLFKNLDRKKKNIFDPFNYYT